jgi:hypothetical protein
MTENADNNVSQNEAFATFVGEKYETYYQKKWQLRLGQIAGFNVAAFFLGAVWLIYRKMYLYAAIFLAIIAVDIAVEMFYPLPETVGHAVNIAIAVMFGVLGNSWYKTYADKKVNQISASFPPEQMSAELAKQGGTNLAAALIATLVLLALVGFGLWAIYSGKFD